MKILLDENIDQNIFKWLKKEKFNVFSINLIQKGITDDEVYDYAIKEKMLIISHDKHFKKFKKLNNYGIIYITNSFLGNFEELIIKIKYSLRYIINNFNDNSKMKNIFITITPKDIKVMYKKQSKKGSFKGYKEKSLKFK